MNFAFACRNWLALFAILLILAPPGATAASPELELEVELEPATRQIRAQAWLVPASREFKFDLHETLEIRGAWAAGRPLRVRAAGHAGTLRAWRVVLPAGAGRLRLEYGGILPALDADLDHRGVLKSLPPMASGQGSFLPAGSGWYPQPAPHFPYRVKLSLPGDQRALVAGRLDREELPEGAGGRYRANFQFSHPADGIDLMAGPWVVRERMVAGANGGQLRLRTYFFRDLDAIPGLSDGYLEDTRRYLELYSGQIGPYPFTEFSVVASPLPTGFGMPTLTYLGAEVLKLPFIRATSLGHEVLHNWWGNGVFVDYEHGNWCEGLTTFMADYAYKERESAEAAREMRLGWLRDFAALPAEGQAALASFRSRTHGAAATVGYGKSAMLFFMLRDSIGADAFQRGLRNLWQARRFKPAAWSDLRLAFEQASGRSLKTFFDQWLDRAGGPAVRIARASARVEAGRTRLDLELEQSAPAYALRLPVELVYSDQAEVRWIESEHLSDTVGIEVDKLPAGVRLDPDLRVWRRLDQEQLPPILRQWVVASSPRLLIATAAPAVREAALGLAERLLEAKARSMSADELALAAADDREGPILLVGLVDEVDALLARAGLPPRPAGLRGVGSAQVWTVERGAGAPLAVVSGQDAGALRVLMRPLPHYGSQSWLVFDGGRVRQRGVWPAPGRLLPVRLQP